MKIPALLSMNNCSLQQCCAKTHIQAYMLMYNEHCDIKYNSTREHSTGEYILLWITPHRLCTEASIHRISKQHDCTRLKQKYSSIFHDKHKNDTQNGVSIPEISVHLLPTIDSTIHIKEFLEEMLRMKSIFSDS